MVREGLGRRVGNGYVPRGSDTAGKGLVDPLPQQKRGSGGLVFQPAAPGRLREPEVLLTSSLAGPSNPVVRKLAGFYDAKNPP